MKWPLIVIILVIAALIAAIACGVPALNWLAWVFNLIAKLFSSIGDLCRWLQKMVSWGIIG